MKKIIILGIILGILASAIAACGKKPGNANTEDNPKGIPEKIVVSSKDDLFDLKLYVDKSIYSVDETIDCYATLEYVGDQDSITIYSSDSLVGFSLKDDKYFDGGYAVNDVLMINTFKKGEIVTYEFSKSGGWTEDDPNADFYQEFYSEKELKLPAGKYEISATINGSLNLEDMKGSEYKKSAAALITVIK